MYCLRMKKKRNLLTSNQKRNHGLCTPCIQSLVCTPIVKVYLYVILLSFAIDVVFHSRTQVNFFALYLHSGLDVYVCERYFRRLFTSKYILVLPNTVLLHIFELMERLLQIVLVVQDRPGSHHQKHIWYMSYSNTPWLKYSSRIISTVTN